MSRKPDALSLAFGTILNKCEASFRYYLEHYLITRDDHDAKSPAKPFPDHPYIGFLADELQHGPDIFYVAKSRQMMMSWLLSAYTLWVCQWKPLKVVLFQSKKEEDAAKMIYKDAIAIGRASFMLSRLPPWMLVCKDEKGGYISLPKNLDGLFSNGKMTFPNGSQAIALAQGAAQVESWSPYVFINDEASLQEEWASAQAAASPALAGGGRGVTVGTMRMPSDYGREIEPSWYCLPDAEGRGLARFKAHGGVPAIRLHYSADPAKDPKTPEGAKWVAHESAKMVGGLNGWRWRQHMEIDPTARSGTLVLPMMSEQRVMEQVAIEPIPVSQQKYWAYDAGLDWGVLNKSVFLIFAMTAEKERYVVYELALEGQHCGGIPGFAQLMRQHPLFARVNGTIQGDPSLWNRDQNTSGGLRSKADIFAQYGVYMTPAKLKGQEADDILVDRLFGHYWAGWETPEFAPRLKVFKTCPGLLKTLSGLRYEEWSESLASERSPKEKIKNLEVDYWDAMKYAEVFWPQYPIYTPPPAVGTFMWYKQQGRETSRRGLGNIMERP